MAGLSCGVIGLPNVGKSTLFNALTASGARVENYPFCTIDPNIGIIEVPDQRLDALNQVEQKARAIPAVIEIVDIAGLVKGASHGEGRGNQFLENIHHVDMLIHVVRAFEDPNVSHVRANLDPAEDIDVINVELIFADLQTTEKAIERYTKKARGNDRDARGVLDILTPLADHLGNGLPARTAGLKAADLKAIADCRLLTLKPVMYVANLGEESLPNLTSPHIAKIAEIAEKEGATLLPVSAKVEAELAELDIEDAQEFAAELGLAESGLNRLIKECYRHLGLITFFTVGDEEVRAWTTRSEATAPEAGAAIHSDFQELFIRVEVIGFDDFQEHGSRHAAKDHGLMRIEGKEYVVRDGDILFFRISH